MLIAAIRLCAERKQIDKTHRNPAYTMAECRYVVGNLHTHRNECFSDRSSLPRMLTQIESLKIDLWMGIISVCIWHIAIWTHCNLFLCQKTAGITKLILQMIFNINRLCNTAVIYNVSNALLWCAQCHSCGGFYAGNTLTQSLPS